MKKTVFSFLAKRIVIPLVVLWLLAMIFITTSVATDFVHQLEANLPHVISSSHFTGASAQTLGYTMVQTLRRPMLWLSAEPLYFFQLPQRPASISSDDWYWGKWELVYGYQAAIAYFNSENQRVVYSGDWLWFTYRQADGQLGYSYIDLNDLEGGHALAQRYFTKFPSGDTAPFLMAEPVSLRGWFEGSQFHPVRIRAGSPLDVVYEREDVPGKTLVTLQPQDWGGLNYIPGSPFVIDGNTFYGVDNVLFHPDIPAQRSLFNTLLRYQVGFEVDGQHYRAELAVQCCPLKYAMLRLLPAYLVSALMLGICLYFLLSPIRKQLTEPLQVINRSYENNRRELSVYGDSPLAELQELAGHFNEKQAALHEEAQKNQQLQTALDYAADAEDNRRKMTSAVAHELKTPLAVIHSYAEGLQEGIAGENAPRYLQIIQEETERMDELVLQMLDLSRLEAGKVRLSRDRFSLSALAAQVLERLTPAIRAKNLQVQLHPPFRDFSLVADEGRIAQVITNLTTNAIKYTPAGGSITLRVFQNGEDGCFQITNDSEPFPPEVLERIWDSFYRADSARAGEGTGLGLAIVKSIIQLHRGSCEARNTKTGVLFSFRIPS